MGVDFEVKAQLVLLVILSISYVNYIIGTVIPPTQFKQLRGMTGYSWNTFTDNFFPGWRGENFFSVFSVYFPAATVSFDFLPDSFPKRAFQKILKWKKPNLGQSLLIRKPKNTLGDHGWCKYIWRFERSWKSNTKRNAMGNFFYHFDLPWWNLAQRRHCHAVDDFLSVEILY